MNNPRALEDGGSSSPMGITGGRPPIHFEGLNDNGSGGGGGKGKLTSWLGRFTQGHVTKRRASVGFDANVGETPLLGMDEDSNSKDYVISATHDITSGGQNDLLKQPIPFGRKRDLSFSDIQTPGGDGDTFLLNYKRKPSIDYGAESSPKPLLTLQNGNILFELDKTSPKDSFSSMKTIHEGKKTSFKSNYEDPSEELQKMGLGGAVQIHDTTSNEPVEEKNSSSIFLIDLETETDGQNIKLVPKTKKFSILNKDWAQSWFFRNDSVDDNAVTGDNDTTTASAGEGKSGADQESSGKKSKDDLSKKPSFIGKIKKLVEENPGGYREMNTWQPQSQ